ncbi:histidine kinase [Halorubrum sp. Atlit-8R]|uniref:sensor domain-containing protein n=1 Tax=unclassified Halorubrum TaxID=2642239 RepID=UPI000EF22635|nr:MULTISPECIES: sensor domain-containing protein [unclassified Halorubrum]RLM71038.1 histidine kinase [Halorubrum sp. Atlit-9R]RLM71906.1 histidine kinase [Halorubrum sp. Atlit-9R]RLM82809.1 histidine kinase [Halorubrum sp. Atlit-8R]
MVSLRPLAALPVVGVVADGRTYRRLLYLLIAVPLWFVYSGFVTFALAFGIVFSVVLVGVGILIAAVVASRIAAGLERWLANRLLGTDLVAADDLPAAADGGSSGAVATVRAYLSAPSTWRGLGFVSLKFWVTVLAFAPLAVLARSLALVAAPIRYPYAPQFGEVNGEPAVWAIDTAPEAALAAGVGVVGLLVGLHLTNLIAGGARLMAVALLGESDESDDGDDADRVTVERDGDRETTDDRDGSDERGADSDDEPDADGFEFDGEPADPDGDPADRG